MEKNGKVVDKRIREVLSITFEIVKKILYFFVFYLFVVVYLNTLNIPLNLILFEKTVNKREKKIIV